VVGGGSKEAGGVARPEAEVKAEGRIGKQPLPVGVKVRHSWHGQYRLLFRLRKETIEVVGLVNRKDLERVIKSWASR
jgi:hypothetical protein